MRELNSEFVDCAHDELLYILRHDTLEDIYVDEQEAMCKTLIALLKITRRLKKNEEGQNET